MAGTGCDRARALKAENPETTAPIKLEAIRRELTRDLPCLSGVCIPPPQKNAEAGENSVVTIPTLPFPFLGAASP